MKTHVKTHVKLAAPVTMVHSICVAAPVTMLLAAPVAMVHSMKLAAPVTMVHSIYVDLSMACARLQACWVRHCRGQH